MIYDCPQCGTPQAAGRTVCPQCHAEFDGPVPADAVVPAAEPANVEAPAAVSEEPVAKEAGAGEQEAAAGEQEAAAAEAAPVREAEPTGEAAAPPSVAADAPPAPPSGPAPYLTSPSYAPPPYSPPLSSSVTPLPYTSTAGAGGPPLGRLTRALLIAFPIVLVLVLGGVYLAGTLNTDSDAVPEPLPAAPVHAATPLPPAPAANAAPVTLQGGSNTNDNTDPHVKLLAGRWVSKSNDFYVFNSDGTGSRGSALNPAGDQPFLWGLVQNRLMLYGAKNETLRFNVGPDNDTVFLAPGSGRYVQYSRAKS